MIVNLLLGGAAGQGVESATELLEIAAAPGRCLLCSKDYMSRVRGGHNFTFLRIGDEDFYGADPDKVHLVAAFDAETLALHADALAPEGRMIHDQGFGKENSDSRFLALPLVELAKKAGNSKVLPTVMVGVVCRLLGFSLQSEELQRAFAGRDEAANLAAYELGYQAVEEWQPVPQMAKYHQLPLLNGNEAIALGAVAAGCGFYCAYPMTPATSVMTYLAGQTNETGMLVEQAEDEIAAVNMAIGAAFVGTRSMTGTSGGGFCLMTEGVSLAAMHELPLVILNSQRPGPATGFPTRTEQADLKMVLNAGHGEFARVVLSVRNPADAYRQTMRSFFLADKYQLPVILLTDEYLADTKVHRDQFPEDEAKWFDFFLDPATDGAEDYLRYQLTDDGISPRRLPGVGHGVVIADSDEHNEAGHITESQQIRQSMVEKRNKKHLLLQGDMEEPEYYGETTPDVLLYGWGSMWGSMRDAVRLLGEQKQLKIGCLCFGDIWPLPTAKLWQYWSQAQLHICVEQNYSGQLAEIITVATGLVEDCRINAYSGRQLSGRQVANRVLEVVNQWK